MMPSTQRPGVDVSVIVTTYNQEPILRQQLNALLEQDFTGTWEIIICDDGSKVTKLANVLRDFQQSPIDIQLIWQPDQGIRPSRARNNGLRVARGDIVLFLDGDIIPESNLLSGHFAAHTQERDRNLLVVGNRLWLDESQLSLCEKRFSRLLSTLRNIATVNDRVLSLQRSFYNGPHPWRACFACNLSVRKSRLIYFDEMFDGAWGLEDSEMACRLVERHGYSVHFDEKLIGYHYQLNKAEFNVYRRGHHEEIVMFMRNVCYFVDKYPDLSLETLYVGLEKFDRDPATDRWFVRSVRPSNFDLVTVVHAIRSWLKNRGVYPQGNSSK